MGMCSLSKRLTTVASCFGPATFLIRPILDREVCLPAHV